MHWGGEPSVKVLARVLRQLEDQGHEPAVFFDANVGYKLGDRYHDDRDMAGLIGVPARQIYVVDKGVAADEVLLQFATDHRLRIVSNDQFRDWRVQFPWINGKGRLLRGTWRDGAVVWKAKF